jgi:hypothetical protein
MPLFNVEMLKLYKHDNLTTTMQAADVGWLARTLADEYDELVPSTESVEYWVSEDGIIVVLDDEGDRVGWGIWEQQ